MPASLDELLRALTGVTAIPVLPFRGGQIDYEGHGRNLDYLLGTNGLDGGLQRVVSIGGTSPLHHVSVAEQLRLAEFTAARIGDRGVYLSGIVPNPLPDAEALVAAQCRLATPPDGFLLMPLTGVADPDGIYREYMAFAERLGGAHGARFVFYLRQSDHAAIAMRLVNESPWFVGIKVGTGPDDVATLVSGVDDSAGLVVWGIGDRSSGPAEAGTRGHTSGINVVFAKASDQINNAQRRGDWGEAHRVENLVAPLEEIRFRDSRRYNYSAVVEAMHLSGFGDIEGGEGAPFNPRLPASMVREVEAAIQPLLEFH